MIYHPEHWHHANYFPHFYAGDSHSNSLAQSPEVADDKMLPNIFCCFFFTAHVSAPWKKVLSDCCVVYTHLLFILTLMNFQILSRLETPCLPSLCISITITSASQITKLFDLSEALICNLHFYLFCIPDVHQLCSVFAVTCTSGDASLSTAMSLIFSRSSIFLANSKI